MTSKTEDFSNAPTRILAEAITKLGDAQFPYRIHPAVRAQYRYMGPEMEKDKQPMYAAVAFGKDDEMTDLEKGGRRGSIASSAS